MRAMVVDDSRAMRHMLGKMLKGLGFEVSEAGNGREGVERLREAGPFDLALVDWNMPEMNGYEFVCAVRSDRSYDEMRVMMVTTETEMEQVQKALAAGANEYVMKPFTPAALTEKLALLGVIQEAS